MSRHLGVALRNKLRRRDHRSTTLEDLSALGVLLVLLAPAVSMLGDNHVGVTIGNAPGPQGPSRWGASVPRPQTATVPRSHAAIPKRADSYPCAEVLSVDLTASATSGDSPLTVSFSVDIYTPLPTSSLGNLYYEWTATSEVAPYGIFGEPVYQVTGIPSSTDATTANISFTFSPTNATEVPIPGVVDPFIVQVYVSGSATLGTNSYVEEAASNPITVDVTSVGTGTITPTGDQNILKAIPQVSSLFGTTPVPEEISAAVSGGHGTYTIDWNVSEISAKGLNWSLYQGSQFSTTLFLNNTTVSQNQVATVFEPQVVYDVALQVHDQLGNQAEVNTTVSGILVNVTGSCPPTYLSTDWNSTLDSYNFENPENVWSIWDIGNCFGMSTTSLLYFLHYYGPAAPVYSDPYFPSPYGNGTITASINPGSYATDGALNNATLAIMLHQVYGQGGLPTPTIGQNPANFALLKTEIAAGFPAAIGMLANLNGRDALHEVVAWGLDSYPNGSVQINLSDPNFPQVPKYAWYYPVGDSEHTAGEFGYSLTMKSGRTIDFYAFHTDSTTDSSQLQLQSQWWNDIPAWAPQWQTQPYGYSLARNNYMLVVASQPVVVNESVQGRNLQDRFAAPSNSETFVQGIPLSSGIEENGMQAYAINTTGGKSPTVSDPGTGASMIDVSWMSNTTGTPVGYSFLLNASSPSDHDYNVTKGPAGFELEVGQQALTLNLSLVSWSLGDYDFLNASQLQFGAGDSVNLTVSNWTALNSTVHSVVTVVVTPPGGSSTTYHLTNGQAGLGAGQGRGVSTGSLPGLWLMAVLAALVVAVVAVSLFLVARRRKGRTSKPRASVPLPSEWPGHGSPQEAPGPPPPAAASSPTPEVSPPDNTVTGSGPEPSAVGGDAMGTHKMYCPECGHPIAEAARFCGGCGTRIEP